MKRLALISLVTLVGTGLAQGCGSPDVKVAENGEAGKSNLSGASGSTHTGGNSSTSGGKSSGGHSGASATGGSFDNLAGGGVSSGGIVNNMAGESSIGGDASGDAGAGDGAGGDSTTGCDGQAPLCFGGDVSKCCGNDPAGQATCQDGKWLCFGGAVAPGCNGSRCTDLFACGPTLMCDRSKQFCQALTGGIGGDEYQCQPYAAECQQNQTCQCQKLPQCQTCNSEFGAMTQTCHLG